MITVKLSGGLGNQLFQYSAALALKTKRGNSEKIAIEYQSKTHESHADRQLSLLKFLIEDCNELVINEKSFFNIYPVKYFIYKVIVKLSSLFGGRDLNGEKKTSKLEWIICNSLGIYTQKANRFFQFTKSFSKNVYITGMFHNVDYFNDIKSDLKKQFVLKEEFYNEKTEKRLKEIKGTQAVCVHVRRGDYLHVDGYAICSKEYFSKGMSHIRNNLDKPVFFVFSDDIEWCKNNLHGEDIVYLDDNNPDYIDFELMRNCRHFVISNSTFSWWAAYLGDDEDKIVVAPNYWAELSPRNWLVLDGWVGLAPNLKEIDI